LIIILCVALLLILLLSIFHLTEWYESVGIGIAIFIAVLVSTFSEYKNEKSFQKLQKEASMIKNQVFRNSSIHEIFVDEIVVGDYVILQSGVKVPADGILIDGLVKVNQASLTGESESLTKRACKENQNKELDLMDNNSLFRGSVIEDGEGVMLVKKVGENSFYGKLSKELAISDSSLSPLQIKLKALSKDISKFGYIGSSLVFLISIFDKVVVNNNFSIIEISKYFTNFGKFLNDIIQSLVFSVVLIVAAVPEGLPMMVAIVLSLNMRKLLSAKVLVRKLLGIETAGSLNILFSDKTGTITKGQLKVNYFFLSNCKKFFSLKELDKSLYNLVSKSIVFNTSSFLSESGEIIGGNSSERAILSFVEKEVIRKYQDENVSILENLPFNSSIKYSATKINENNNIITFVKGAPEIILKNCSKFIDELGNIVESENFKEITKEIDFLADQGYRLLALAFSNDENIDLNDLSNKLILLGILAIRDEIREESYESIQKALNAGIQVVMITGDRKGTAISIAKEIGLIKNQNDIVLTSEELNKLSDNDVEKILHNLRVIARALPTDKSRLVKISKKLGFVTGMTGDGVNDAPALKQSDVSFAMGSGSEVSKEASDIVILDDNFNSIVNAILYGRSIFKSIRKFIVFQLTVNVSAVFISFIGAILNIQPITVIQILWINVIMDTLAAISFGGEPALERYLKEKPINKSENILNSYMKNTILVNSIFIILMSFIFLKSGLFHKIFYEEKYLMSGFFNYFVFSIVINGFNARSETLNILEHIRENPMFIYIMTCILALQVTLTYIGGKLFNVVPLNFEQWITIIIISLLIIPFDLVRKIIWKFLNNFNQSINFS